MAKTPQKQETPSAPRNKVETTVARKAKRVIQSNGIPFFREWANKQTSGGRRRRGGHPPLCGLNTKLFNRLIEEYQEKNRKMDQPKDDS